MPSWVLCVLCAVVLIGPGLAANDTQQDQAYISSLISALGPNGEVPEIEPPGDIVISGPILGSSPNAQLIGDGQVPDGEFKVIKIKDIKATLNTRIEPNNPLVRDEALQMVAKFSEPGDSTIQQICSIYSYLKNGDPPIKGWIYVQDPRGLEYFNFANESVRVGDKSGCTGAGDCDDFAILMASLMESIGGTSRIILAYNNSTGNGHAYAEVYLGNLSTRDSQVGEIIDWLKQKYNTNNIFTYNDMDSGDVWLNLDWGSDEKGNAHPGGPFCRADKKIVLTIRGMFKKTPISSPLAIKNDEVLQTPAVRLNITKNVTESNSAEIWYNKGIAFSYLGKYDEALQAYDKAIEIDPQYANAWHNKGNVLYGQGKYDEALQAYDKVIEIDPQYANAWSGRGNTLERQGKYDEALQAYDRAIELDSELANAWGGKSLALYDQGKYDEALDACDRATELDPQYSIAWRSKGDALYSLGKYDEALQAYDKAIEIDPQYSIAWHNKGNVLYGQGKYDEALQAYDKVIEIDPQYANAWSGRGNTLERQGKYDEALQAYDRAIELDSELANAWGGKGSILETLGMYDEAIKCCDKANELDPQYAYAWCNKGLALDGQGKYDEALQAYDKAIEIDPQHAYAWYNKGLALEKLGRTTEAETAFAKAKELGYTG